jgi:transposase-like protein
VIIVDGHPACARAIADLKSSGELGRRCRCRPAPYLNNIVEQDHRFIKKRIAASLRFRSVGGGLQTVAGYEAMHAIRKGQIRWLPKGILSVRSNSSSGSSALSDHGFRRFNSRPLHAVCDRSIKIF